jgi:condensin complex subunit 1
MSKMLDSISSGLQAEIDATQRDLDSDDQDQYTSHKPALEMYALLLHWFILAAEKYNPREGGQSAAPAPKARVSVVPYSNMRRGLWLSSERKGREGSCL